MRRPSRPALIVGALLLSILLIGAAVALVLRSSQGGGELVDRADFEALVGAGVEYQETSQAQRSEVGVTPCTEQTHVGAAALAVTPGVINARSTRVESSNGTIFRETMLVYDTEASAARAVARLTPTGTACRARAALRDLSDVRVDPLPLNAGRPGWAFTVTYVDASGTFTTRTAALQRRSTVAYITIEGGDVPVDPKVAGALVEKAGQRLVDGR